MGLGLALIGGLSVAAAPAQAVEGPNGYSVTGSVAVEMGDQAPTYLEDVNVHLVESDISTRTDETGNFMFSGLASGDYSLQVYVEADVPGGFGYSGSATFTINGGDVTVDTILVTSDAPTPTPEPTPTVPAKATLPDATVTISGNQAVGSTLTATVAGWPEGTTLSYTWGAVVPGQQNSGDIEGAEASTLVVTADTVNKLIWVAVDGMKDGYDSSWVTTFLAPQLTAAAAPVSNSVELAAFLADYESTPMSQTAAGLPAGSLDPTKSYTANVPFSGDDSFVDVYLYSTPTLVGSFPVVNGIAQVTLSADVLRKVGAGPHTLVVVGQFFGDVSSVAMNVSAMPAAAGAAMLAATGIETALPVGAAAILLLLGGAIVLVNRRRIHA